MEVTRFRTRLCDFDFNSHTAPCTWNSSLKYNEMFLRISENYFNDVLQLKGYVSLNEILNYIGLKRILVGEIYGWIKDEGDNYIDFGYMDNTFAYAWMISDDFCAQNIHLNFNANGPIWGKLVKRRLARFLCDSYAIYSKV